LSDIEVDEIYLNIFQPVQKEVVRLWYINKVKDDGLTSDVLIERADKKIYEDKEKYYKNKTEISR
jgi:hypothetical protein